MGSEAKGLALSAVDPRAAAAGLTPGLPLAEARGQVPGLVSLQADPAGDRAALTRLASWCGRYSPWTAPDGEHDQEGAAGAMIDASGCAHLFGGEAAMLADLVARLERLGFTARAAMAETPGAAWAVARFATTAATPWRIVPPGALRRALAPLPPAALRIGAAEAETLHRLGLRSIGELETIPTAALAARLGRGVARRLDQALGRLEDPIDPLRHRTPLEVRRGFGEPIGRREDLAAAIESLAAALCRRLEESGEGARRLMLVLHRVDGTLQEVTLGTSRATRDPAHLKRLFAERLDGLDPGFGVEIMTLAARAAESLTARQTGFMRERDRTVDLSGLPELVDRLESRLGAGMVTRPRACESYLPERAVAAAPPFVTAYPAAFAKGPPRPLRLLDRPQPIEATALLPDYPPVQYRWRRLLHRVSKADGPERIAPEWWREIAAGATARDYFRIESEEGRRSWLFRAQGRWYLHGAFA